MTLMDELERKRERATRDAENSARLAQAYAVFTSVGQGSTQYKKRVPFGLTFTEKPVISYAAEVDSDELRDVLEDYFEGDPPEDDSSLSFPQCTGFVTSWDRDERDFYVGCWIAANVRLEGIPDVDVSVSHHFTFSGIAMKDIPPDQEDAVE